MRKDWPADCTAAKEYDAELEHLVSMARDPIWKRYAWQKSQKLEKDCHELWGGISEELLKRMNTEVDRASRSGRTQS